MSKEVLTIKLPRYAKLKKSLNTQYLNEEGKKKLQALLRRQRREAKQHFSKDKWNLDFGMLHNDLIYDLLPGLE